MNEWALRRVRANMERRLSWLEPRLTEFLSPGETLLHQAPSTGGADVYLVVLAFWPLFLLFQLALYVHCKAAGKLA